MDNQQERLDMLLHWLAGIIDGEGSITLTVRREKKNAFSYRPRIHITNTDEELIKLCSEILDGFDVQYYIQRSKAKSINHRDRIDLIIIGMRRCLKALSILEPVLRIKKPQAHVMIMYCLDRLKKPKNAPIDDDDMRWVNMLSEINKTGVNVFKILRDYTPDSDFYSDEDIVHTLSKVSDTVQS